MFPQGGSEAAVTPSQSLQGAQEKPFKLKLSLPGKDIGGEWLCQLTGEALAYQSYCGTAAGHTEQEFTPVVEADGKTYLKNQDDKWLSYESVWNLLYISYKINRVAWKIEGNRLIRESDGAVLTWKHKKWPLADTVNWLSAEPVSDNALTVEKVVVGYSSWNFTISPEAAAILTAAVHVVGVNYTPIAVATQDVVASTLTSGARTIAGTKYVFLSKAVEVAPNAPQRAVKLYIFKPLPGQGEPHVTQILDVSPALNA